jgi:hypothetical protein
MHGREGHHGDAFARRLGYGVCAGCGVAVQRARLASGAHACEPARYARHQIRRLHWRRSGFEDALGRWLQTPAGRLAQHDARRRVRGDERRPDEP